MLHAKAVKKIRMPVEPVIDHFGGNMDLLSRFTDIHRQSIYYARKRGYFNDNHTRLILASTGKHLQKHVVTL